MNTIARCHLLASVVLGVALSVAVLPEVVLADDAEPIVLKEALLIRSVSSYSRSPIHVDFVAAKIVQGKWKTPAAGDKIAIPGRGERVWTTTRADDKGWIGSRRYSGGYAYWDVDSPTDRVMILEANGHGMVYVNGVPRTGDVYRFGITKVPVLLKKGKNNLLFTIRRGQFKARLVAPKQKAFLSDRDELFPDLLIGKKQSAWAAVIVVNASTKPASNLYLTVEGDGVKATRTAVPTLPPLSFRKVRIQYQTTGIAKTETGKANLTVCLESGAGDAPRKLDGHTFEVRVSDPNQLHRRTFVSKIDGSVQYYGIQPATTGIDGNTNQRPALFLSLHGAGVQARGQAAAYAPKRWGHVVAPTNRRRFGFDWEDWGRMDAIEVLELAQKQLNTDPQRTYLTGHSMGGHGTWHLGATFPDRFAAIGPSAGWISFFTYGSRRSNAKKEDRVVELVRRAKTSSDTLLLLRNFDNHGVYVVHGSADNNVPVTQARTMVKKLGEFHKDFRYHEQPKAGHWWGNSDEPGAECVDWIPMFDFFARRALPPTNGLRNVEFVTVNPGVSGSCHWVTVEAQEKALRPSSVKIRFDRLKARFVGTTANVVRFSLDLRHLLSANSLTDKSMLVDLDGQKLENIGWNQTADGKLCLAKRKGKWSVTEPPSKDRKGSHRYGPFREAFTNNMMFVYGTKGTAEESAWAYQKARFDAEQFWYRGNGSIDVLADVEFEASKHKERNIILYGNADTNSAWKTLLANSPVQVENGRLQVGQKTMRADNLACLFLRPRADSKTAFVAALSGTGLKGMRATDRVPVFVSGAAIPDVMIFTPRMLSGDTAGLEGAGYFGMDWSVDSGEFAWR